MIEEMLEFNKKFVAEKQYEKFSCGKYPDKKIAILTCMDTRLVELLPAALNIKNGDVKIIKNAGGVVTNPFGSVIRSLLVSIIELGVTEIMVIGHTDCGVQHIDSDIMIHHMKERGITQEAIDLMKYCGINFEKWLAGFDDVETSVKETVSTIVHHPLIPKDVKVGGYVINTETGELKIICGTQD
ncbi:MAG: carbonic anhydrase [Lachnospiraceae bacterium]|nr:carbonic anhydrase [Lachnospiraceae bacterium]MDD3795625.1 carbonic anhydrase [Lachnospiraceae bacterium]